MFNSAILDVVIGLVFLFVLVSLAGSALREAIEGLLKTRAIMLERGIRELLGDRNAAGGAAASRAPTTAGSLTRIVFEHPQIAGLFVGDYPDRLSAFWRRWRQSGRVAFGSNLPSYIPSRNFALALIDLIGRGPISADGEPLAAEAIPLDVPGLRRRIGALPDARLRRALLVALDDAGDDFDAVRGAIEHWYDSAMDRVSGWYRRETQGVLLAIGLGLAVLLNIDAIAVGQRLLVDEPWRDSIVSAAQAEASQPLAPSGVAALEEQLRQNGFFIGGPLQPATQPLTLFGLEVAGSGIASAFLRALPGYLIIALATSLGAPFWFDLLNKIMAVRSTIKPPEKSPEGAGDGRFAPTTPAARASAASSGGDPVVAAPTARDRDLAAFDPALRTRGG